MRAKDQGQGLRIRVPLGGPGWEEGPERPEARGQRPEVRGQRPEARGQRPEARDQRPEARGQRPGGQDARRSKNMVLDISNHLFYEVLVVLDDSPPR